jgi:Ca2+-binding EF-hand superfamily protein
VGQYVALEEVPNIMRALGFYPTELQVQDMINEVKFSQYVDTGKTVSILPLNGFYLISIHFICFKYP